MRLAELFSLGQAVKVPSIIHSSCKGKIVGMEDGKNNKFINYDGWVYSLAFEGGGEAFRVTEAELTEWNK